MRQRHVFPVRQDRVSWCWGLEGLGFSRTYAVVLGFTAFDSVELQAGLLGMKAYKVIGHNPHNDKAV